jgi:hypothetical protein
LNDFSTVRVQGLKGGHPARDADTTPEISEMERLRTENARLHAVLDAHGTDFQRSLAEPVAPQQSEASRLSTDEKDALFRRLFQGRTDIYPLRWQSKAGKSGYSPACANEWRPGICEKPRIKCSGCGHRLLIPLSDQIIFDHLAGKHTIGVYPLLADDTCHFLAVDFDDADWREDALAFRSSCTEPGVPAALEISRSGNGAHIWIFFRSAVPARDAQRLGTAIISHTCARMRQLKLASVTSRPKLGLTLSVHSLVLDAVEEGLRQRRPNTLPCGSCHIPPAFTGSHD